jgi:hypothetical protein
MKWWMKLKFDLARGLVAVNKRVGQVREGDWG